MHVVVGGTRVGWPCCDALFCVGKVEIDRALGKKNVVQDAESPPLMMYIEKSFLGKKKQQKRNGPRRKRKGVWCLCMTTNWWKKPSGS